VDILTVANAIQLTSMPRFGSFQVRIAACSALVAFVQGAGGNYCETNSGYLAAGVVLHMDDAQPGVQEAAARVLEAMALTKPAVVIAEVEKVKARFRAQHYCEKVLELARQQLQQSG
jgi:hypothetical protein